jgi:hypothetical protein
LKELIENMTPDEQKAFLREKRGSEAHFDDLLNSLHKAIAAAEAQQDSQTANQLKEVSEKQVPAYTTAKQNGGTAWPEFEQFVTAWERALMQADNK